MPTCPSSTPTFPSASRRASRRAHGARRPVSRYVADLIRRDVDLAGPGLLRTRGRRLEGRAAAGAPRGALREPGAVVMLPPRHECLHQGAQRFVGAAGRPAERPRGVGTPRLVGDARRAALRRAPQRASRREPPPSRGVLRAAGLHPVRRCVRRAVRRPPGVARRCRASNRTNNLLTDRAGLATT